MLLDVHVLPGGGTLPTLAWRWDPETDILSGSFTPARVQTGYTGTVELDDDDGSTVLIDVVGGILSGVDIVVWPEVTALAGLAATVEARVAQVLVPTQPPRRGSATTEADKTMTVATDLENRVFHLRVGTRRPVEPLRVADRLIVEVDAAHRLAGLWLDGVPLRPDLI